LDAENSVIFGVFSFSMSATLLSLIRPVADGFTPIGTGRIHDFVQRGSPEFRPVASTGLQVVLPSGMSEKRM
jgi:hypothetical protein